MNQVQFSIVTISYNGEKEIERTIKSVINQSYKNYEYILIDGASSDGTMKIVNKYREHFAKIVSEPDTGIYNAMNKGLKLCTRDYVLFANCGDMLASPLVLESVANDIMSNYHDMPDLVYGSYQEYNNGAIGSVIPCRSHKKVWYGMFASHQSIFCKLSVINQNNICFDESYKIAADYKFILTMVKYSKSFLQLKQSISLFDVTGVSSVNQDCGLAEADMARKEVMNYSWLRRKLVVEFSLVARFAKKHFRDIYKILRYR